MSRKSGYLVFASALLLVLVAVFIFKKPPFQDFPKPVPSHVIKIAKERLHLLQPDMSIEKVITTLGLSNYCWDAESGGPNNHFWTTCRMGNGYNLYFISTVTYRSTNMPAKWKLLSVSLDGETWKPQNDDKNK
jgi:hypothetical protein